MQTSSWSYRWNTARLQNRLDYGTYTIYVVTDPVDSSRLGGHPFSTLSGFLNEARVIRGIGSGRSGIRLMWKIKGQLL